MDAQSESTSKIFDILKHSLSILLITIGVVAFYYFSDVVWFTLLYRVLSLVAILLLAFGIILSTTAGRNVWFFALEAKQEVRKVIWPSREETIKTTLLIFGTVFIVGLFLWCLDMFLFWGIRSLTGQGG